MAKQSNNMRSYLGGALAVLGLAMAYVGAYGEFSDGPILLLLGVIGIIGGAAKAGNRNVRRYIKELLNNF